LTGYLTHTILELYRYTSLLCTAVIIYNIYSRNENVFDITIVRLMMIKRTPPVTITSTRFYTIRLMSHGADKGKYRHVKVEELRRAVRGEKRWSQC
jgi:hypothetical protein